MGRGSTGGIIGAGVFVVIVIVGVIMFRNGSFCKHKTTANTFLCQRSPPAKSVSQNFLQGAQSVAKSIAPPGPKKSAFATHTLSRMANSTGGTPEGYTSSVVSV